MTIIRYLYNKAGFSVKVPGKTKYLQKTENNFFDELYAIFVEELYISIKKWQNLRSFEGKKTIETASGYLPWSLLF